MSASSNIFEQHLGNIPHLVGEEADVGRYLRALASMLAAYEDEIVGDNVDRAMRDAVTFVANDAYRRGFEICHTNVVLPLREETVSQNAALVALNKYGLKVRDAISTAFEEEPGVPNSLSVEIDELELPAPTMKDLQ